MNLPEPSEHFGGELLLDMLARHARETPEAIALLAPEQRCLTYADLFSTVMTIRAHLSSRGIEPGDRVALVHPAGLEMAVALLGLLMGATAAPLNPAYKQAEFDFYLTDARAEALVIDQDSGSDALRVAKNKGLTVLDISDLMHGLVDTPQIELGDTLNAPQQVPTGDDIALILHTSGTTSRPKSVPLTQMNLAVSAENIAHSLVLSQVDRCLNIMPLFHVHGMIGALLSSLSAGASIVCPPGFQPLHFLSWLEEFQPTWYSAVPTMHQLILTRAKKLPKSGNSLRFIRSCSAALPPQVMQELEETFQVPVIEAYGMTEASHQMSCNPLPPELRKPGSVGLPTGTEIAIMDPEETLVREGCVGEIVIRGLSVTAGYENNQEANAQSFTAGWFHTGDQGYIDPEGYLVISGRIKEIINRGGEKIAPREIDEVILQHPAVAQAVAFPVPHPRLGEDIAAAVVLKEGHNLDDDELQQFVANHLARFKVPRQYFIVDEIPTGSTGKIQRMTMGDFFNHHSG